MKVNLNYLCNITKQRADIYYCPEKSKYFIMLQRPTMCIRNEDRNVDKCRHKLPYFLFHVHVCTAVHKHCLCRQKAERKSLTASN